MTKKNNKITLCSIAGNKNNSLKIQMMILFLAYLNIYIQTQLTLPKIYLITFLSIPTAVVLCKILKKENEIRKILGKYLQEVILQNEQVRTDLTMLPSACFEVLVNAEGQIVLRGGGNGHGIGMSQYGARGMAEKGYSYKEILDYYYDNIVVKKL